MGTSFVKEQPQALNISLELHLLDKLRPLLPLLPDTLAADLTPYITELPHLSIPYTTLHEISKWTRTAEGRARLCTISPSLDSSTYSMVALLAGSKTSPERNFGDYVPPKDPEEVEADKAQERKTITALLNSLLSIGGAGFAAWWAADKTGWKDEWKVLLALFVAIVVAISEAVLYLIWQSRRSKAKSMIKKAGHNPVLDRYKKDDGDSDTLLVLDVQREEKTEGNANLRQRH